MCIVYHFYRNQNWEWEEKFSPGLQILTMEDSVWWPLTHETITCLRDYYHYSVTQEVIKKLWIFSSCTKKLVKVVPSPKMTMKSSSAPTSFVSKPPRGWLHPDHLFAREGGVTMTTVGSLVTSHLPCQVSTTPSGTSAVWMSTPAWRSWTSRPGNRKVYYTTRDRIDKIVVVRQFELDNHVTLPAGPP